MFRFSPFRPSNHIVWPQRAHNKMQCRKLVSGVQVGGILHYFAASGLDVVFEEPFFMLP